jgi:hypothetical protein
VIRTEFIFNATWQRYCYLRYSLCGEGKFFNHVGLNISSVWPIIFGIINEIDVCFEFSYPKHIKLIKTP